MAKYLPVGPSTASQPARSGGSAVLEDVDGSVDDDGCDADDAATLAAVGTHALAVAALCCSIGSCELFGCGEGT